MKKKKAIKNIKESLALVLIVLLLFTITDIVLTAGYPFRNHDFFPKNDFEKTIAIHGTTNFERVFFGNSAVVSAFREELSDSGYVEFGLNWGKATYMQYMLEGGYITVSESLVLGLNIFTLMDNLDSDQSYIWHRRSLEPYVFFFRNRLRNFFTGALDNVLDGDFSISRYTRLQKFLYRGTLTDEQMEARLVILEERFWGLPLSDFYSNLTSLERIAVFCKANDIRLRVVWMPYNPFSPKPELYLQIMDKANAILYAFDIEVLDLSDAFSQENFHDTGHFNDEVGAPNFTREIDLWLRG